MQDLPSFLGRCLSTVRMTTRQARICVASRGVAAIGTVRQARLGKARLGQARPGRPGGDR
jgi:hypothetical protein